MSAGQYQNWRLNVTGDIVRSERKRRTCRDWEKMKHIGSVCFIQHSFLTSVHHPVTLQHHQAFPPRLPHHDFSHYVFLTNKFSLPKKEKKKNNIYIDKWLDLYITIDEYIDRYIYFYDFSYGARVITLVILSKLCISVLFNKLKIFPQRLLLNLIIYILHTRCSPLWHRVKGKNAWR